MWDLAEAGERIRKLQACVARAYSLLKLQEPFKVTGKVEVRLRKCSDTYSLHNRKHVWSCAALVDHMSRSSEASAAKMLDLNDLTRPALCI